MDLLLICLPLNHFSRRHNHLQRGHSNGATFGGRRFVPDSSSARRPRPFFPPPPLAREQVAARRASLVVAASAAIALLCRPTRTYLPLPPSCGRTKISSGGGVDLASRPAGRPTCQSMLTGRDKMIIFEC